MKISCLRSSCQRVGGILFFGRMPDQIRLHAQGKLPADYNLGAGMDGRCARFLQVQHERIAQPSSQDATDKEILEWRLKKGRRPGEEDILVWNAFMSKRGWRDEASEGLAKAKRGGFARRDDIQTFFDFQRAQEAQD